MKLGLPDQAGFLALLKRLQGTGYASDDDSVRVAELTGVAKIAALASEALDAVVKEMFVSHAVETLDEHDRLRSMPTDINQTTAQRQARLVAFTRSLPKLLRTRLSNSMEKWLGVGTGTTISGVAYQSKAHGASHWGGLVVTRLEPAATREQLRVIDTILQRGLPARALVKRGANVYAEESAPVSGAVIYSASPAYLPTPGGPIVAPLEQFPGSVVSYEEYREMQCMQFWAPRRGGAGTTSLHFSFTHGQVGYPAETLYVSGLVSPATTITLDTTDGNGWDERLVQAWAAIDNASFPDSTASGIDHVWLSPSKLGTSPGTAYSHAFTGSSLAADLKLSINGSGHLTLENTHVTESIHFRMFIRKTARFVQGQAPVPEPFQDNDQYVSSDLIAMHKAAQIRNPSNTTYGDMIQGGDAIRRILYTGPMQQPGGDNPHLVTLDTSINWRNRALLITPVCLGSDTAVQVATANGLTAQLADGGGGNSVALSRVLLTGAGATENAAAQGARQMVGTAYAPAEIWIWADSSTGHLMAEMKDVSDGEYAHGFFMVTATSPLGLPVTAAETICQQLPNIYPIDLNRAQNMGCYAQGQSDGVDAVTLPPLGLVCEGGLPLKPLSWRVRERLGSIEDRTIEVRQKIFGQRKRVVSVQVTAGQTLELDAFSVTPVMLDGTFDQMDYRDRFIQIEGRISSGAITLGTIVQQSDVTGVEFAWTLYTGPFGNQTFTPTGSGLTFTFVFGRVGTDVFQSRLTVTNANGSSRFINMMIDATGFLGLTDRRLNGSGA